MNKFKFATSSATTPVDTNTKDSDEQPSKEDDTPQKESTKGDDKGSTDTSDEKDNPSTTTPVDTNTKDSDEQPTKGNDTPQKEPTRAYKSMIIHPIYNRCLSIREVARIQSFNDNYIFKNTKTSQYQQLANAVPPNLAKALAISVKNYLYKNNLPFLNNKRELEFFQGTSSRKIKTEYTQLNIFDSEI